jgi:hypothetical protein
LAPGRQIRLLSRPRASVAGAPTCARCCPHGPHRSVAAPDLCGRRLRSADGPLDFRGGPRQCQPVLAKRKRNPTWPVSTGPTPMRGTLTDEASGS